MSTNRWAVEHNDGTTTTINADAFELFSGSYQFFTGPRGANPKLCGDQVADIPAAAVKTVKLSNRGADTVGEAEPEKPSTAVSTIAIMAVVAVAAYMLILLGAQVTC